MTTRKQRPLQHLRGTPPPLPQHPQAGPRRLNTRKDGAHPGHQHPQGRPEACSDQHRAAKGAGVKDGAEEVFGREIVGQAPAAAAPAKTSGSQATVLPLPEPGALRPLARAFLSLATALRGERYGVLDLSLTPHPES
ncbi:MAG TPA: hypothetical protein VK425_10275, partial [Acidimicrobiales bacterium]|nr:hypothetical protein [Acidimicrobiales bacterium]